MRQRTEEATERGETHTNGCVIDSPTQRCRRQVCTSIPQGVRRRTAQAKIRAPSPPAVCRRCLLYGGKRHTVRCVSLGADHPLLYRGRAHCTEEHGPKHTFCLSFLPLFFPKLLAPPRVRSQSALYGADA
jgi:hypothetical protein